MTLGDMLVVVMTIGDGEALNERSAATRCRTRGVLEGVVAVSVTTDTFASPCCDADVMDESSKVAMDMLERLVLVGIEGAAGKLELRPIASARRRCAASLPLMFGDGMA